MVTTNGPARGLNWAGMRAPGARALIVVVLTSVLVRADTGARTVQAPSPFAAQVAALSEPAGYFDTDNLISNERSYLQVVQDLKKRQVHGGAYIGVGPDQNFSYIAEIRPSIAYMVDVRRDNLLLHLLFKALFAASRTRIDYLAQLTGRAVPGDVEAWRAAPIDRLVAHIDAAPQPAPAGVDALRRRVDEAIARFGVPITAAERATIDRFHRRFIADGLSLRFQSTGRAPQSYYPTLRDLLRETDESGRQANYLASEEAFQFVKGLEARDLIVPVVGNLAGTTAMPAIAAAIAARHEHVAAFYVSNVEFYLFGDGSFSRFAANVGRLPHAANAVIIRSIFGRYAAPTRPGDASLSQLQTIDDFLREHGAGR
jgi:hypothetical protein